MIQCHWDNFNTFEHYGSGDLDMLGWDSLRSEDTLRLFHFNEMEAADLRARLLKTMPDELLALASEGPITVDAVRHTLANATAARFSDLDSVIAELYRGKQIEIIGANNRARSPKLLVCPRNGFTSHPVVDKAGNPPIFGRKPRLVHGS